MNSGNSSDCACIIFASSARKQPNTFSNKSATQAEIKHCRNS